MSEAAPRKTAPGLEVASATFRVCAEEYSSFLSPYCHARPTQKAFDNEMTLAHAWQTQSFVAARAENTPIFRNRTQKEIQDVGHLLEITRFITGGEYGISEESIIHRMPGPIYVMDHRHPLRTMTSAYRVQQMFVSRAELNIPEDWRICERVIAADTPIGCLLHECMTDFYTTLAQNEGVIPPEILERFQALLKINLGVHPQRSDVRAQLRQVLFEKICVYIEQNLGNPQFSTETILQAFGVSRASLYRMFQHHDGVRHYITQRRAVRAIIEIAAPPKARGALRRAAERWGFSTQPNFNRTINKLFGAPPSQLQPAKSEPPKFASEGAQILEEFAELTAIAA